MNPQEAWCSCRGEVRICQECGRTHTEYRERCEAHQEEEPETIRGGNPVWISRTECPHCTQQLRNERERERSHVIVHDPDFERNIEAVWALHKYWRNERPTPFTDAQLEMRYYLRLQSGERIHPFVSPRDVRDMVPPGMLEVWDAGRGVPDPILLADLQECLDRQREADAHGGRLLDGDLFYNRDRVLARHRERVNQLVGAFSLEEARCRIQEMARHRDPDPTETSDHDLLIEYLAMPPLPFQEYTRDFGAHLDYYYYHPDREALLIDIEHYIRYLNEYPDKHRNFFLILVRRVEDHVRQHWNFVPRPPARSFQDWYAAYRRQDPHCGALSSTIGGTYTKYLNGLDMVQHEEIDRLLDELDRMARNNRRYLYYFSGSLWQPFEVQSVPHLYADRFRPMTFFDWTQSNHQTRIDQVEPILDSTEYILETDVSTYECEYLSQQGRYNGPEIQEFRAQREAIHNRRADFDFSPEEQTQLLSFKRYRYQDLDYLQAWADALSSYEQYLSWHPGSPLQQFIAVRDRWVNSEREAFEARSELPQEEVYDQEELEKILKGLHNILERLQQRDLSEGELAQRIKAIIGNIDQHGHRLPQLWLDSRLQKIAEDYPPSEEPTADDVSLRDETSGSASDSTGDRSMVDRDGRGEEIQQALYRRNSMLSNHNRILLDLSNANAPDQEYMAEMNRYNLELSQFQQDVAHLNNPSGQVSLDLDSDDLDGSEFFEDEGAMPEIPRMHQDLPTRPDLRDLPDGHIRPGLDSARVIAAVTQELAIREARRRLRGERPAEMPDSEEWQSDDSSPNARSDGDGVSLDPLRESEVRESEERGQTPITITLTRRVDHNPEANSGPESEE
ncbi:hypothetical protein B0O99DRAFT_727002 [Bisporella sp. PMI_857]|nr:hypothetical protein B0O99DRAFT_727002 [Bisporella sp. PMI_857]